MKDYSKEINSFLCIIIIFLLYSCASHKPTIITNISDIQKINLDFNKLTINCSYYRLKKVDNLKNSHETRFIRDQKLAITVVQNQINNLCSEDKICITRFHLIHDKTYSNKDNYIDLKIHYYVNWIPVFIQILPVYYSVNESYCITADLYKSNEIEKSITEWGYIRESGIWLFDFPEKPRSTRLRGYLVNKVLNEAIKEYND